MFPDTIGFVVTYSVTYFIYIKIGLQLDLAVSSSVTNIFVTNLYVWLITTSFYHAAWKEDAV